MMQFFRSISLCNLQKQAKTWHWLLLALILLTGSLLTYYVVHSEDTEMRDHLITYANTIERSIDWRPFENVLNTNPNNVTLGKRWLNRHCEERSDAAIQNLLLEQSAGLPRFARNDGFMNKSALP